MDRRVFTAVLLCIVVVALVCLAFALFRPFLLALLWAAVLAVVTYGAYEKLCVRLKGRATLAALLMSLAVLVVIVTPFLGVTFIFVSDAVQLANRLADDDDGEAAEEPAEPVAEAERGWRARVETHPWTEWVLAQIEEWTDRELTFDDLVQQAQSSVGTVLDLVKNMAGFLVRLLTGIFFVMLSLFYFYRDGPAAVAFLRGLLPMADENREHILNDLRGAINAAVRGGLGTALVQGFLGGLIVAILGVGGAVFWGSVMALASLIPLVGTAIVWAPMALLLGVQGETTDALVLVAYGVIVIGMADNIVRPLLVGKHMEAHPLLLFFGILGGISLFGFVGIVLGPLVVAILTATAQILRREFEAPAAPAQTLDPRP